MQSKKSIMCEIIGVEPNQRYTFPGGVNGPYYVDEEGHNRDKRGDCLSDEEIPYWEDAVNEGGIQLLDRYGSQGKDIMRHMLAVGYKYIVRSYGIITFTDSKPERVRESNGWSGYLYGASLPPIYDNLFLCITNESEPVDIEEALK